MGINEVYRVRLCCGNKVKAVVEAEGLGSEDCTNLSSVKEVRM